MEKSSFTSLLSSLIFMYIYIFRFRKLPKVQMPYTKALPYVNVRKDEREEDHIIYYFASAILRFNQEIILSRRRFLTRVQPMAVRFFFFFISQKCICICMYIRDIMTTRANYMLLLFFFIGSRTQQMVANSWIQCKPDKGKRNLRFTRSFI